MDKNSFKAKPQTTLQSGRGMSENETFNDGVAVYGQPQRLKFH
jgi:hypothetical protein